MFRRGTTFLLAACLAAFLAGSGAAQDKNKKEFKKVVAALIVALDDPADEVRMTAAKVMGKLGPAAKDAVPALADAARFTDQFSSHFCFFALGKIGPAAIPALFDTLKDQDKSVRSGAIRALSNIISQH